MLLMILILGRENILSLLTKDFLCGEELVSSGLLFALCLVVIGYINCGIYNVFFVILNRIGEKSERQYLDKIYKNEL